MTDIKPSIVIVVQDGIIQEVATTSRKEVLYRIIDLDDEGQGDFYTETTGIDVDTFTKEKLGLD